MHGGRNKRNTLTAESVSHERQLGRDGRRSISPGEDVSLCVFRAEGPQAWRAAAEEEPYPIGARPREPCSDDEDAEI
jgi:hypothetical protein